MKFKMLAMTLVFAASMFAQTAAPAPAPQDGKTKTTCTCKDCKECCKDGKCDMAEHCCGTAACARKSGDKKVASAAKHECCAKGDAECCKGKDSKDMKDCCKGEHKMASNAKHDCCGGKMCDRKGHEKHEGQ